MSEPSDPTTEERLGPSGGRIDPTGAGRWTLAIALIVGLGLGVIAVSKFAAILAGQIVGSAVLGLYFGDPYYQLPADVRSGLDKRATVIEPASVAQRTDNQRSEWTADQLRGGLVRLDDATLIRRYRVVAGGVGSMPVGPCAEIARGFSYEAHSVFLTSLSLDSRAEFVEIAVQAMEAQAHGTPVPRVVTQDQADHIFDALAGVATSPEISAVEAWRGDATKPDPMVCAGIRAFQAVALRRPTADLATIARYDVQQ